MPQSADNIPLSFSLSDNLREIKEIFADNGDLTFHLWQFGDQLSLFACSVYYQSLIQEQEANFMKSSLQDLLPHFVGPGTEVELSQLKTFFENNGVSSKFAKIAHTMEESVDKIVNGSVVIFVDQWDKAIYYKAVGVETRQVSEPASEVVVQGPREGCVENLQKNKGLIRKRLKTPKLKMVSLYAGGFSRTEVAYCYIEGAVNEESLAEFRGKLSKIPEMEILETSYIGELLEENIYSPFPQFRTTERPDVAVAALIEGKILVMVDGTSTLLLCPALFPEFFQSSEDYYQRTVISSLIRLLRIFAFVIALMLPSIYIALTTFHTELIPTVLLLAIIDAREGLPFPAFVEAVLMEFFFELLREAGVRLPKPIGSAVSIVGALVIGDAAITAGIASPAMVIIVALTGIASFAIPQYSIAIGIRILRFFLMILASFMGGFGLMIGLLLILLHLCKIRTLGQPYLSPLAPFRYREWRDVFIRAPLNKLTKTPRYLKYRHEKH